MKILVIIQNTAARGTYEWLNRLAARVEALHLVTSDHGGHAFPDNVILENSSGANLIWQAARAVMRLVAKPKVGTVYVHAFLPGATFAGIWCKLRGIPLITGTDQSAIVNRLAECIIAPSPQEALDATSPRGNHPKTIFIQDHEPEQYSDRFVLEFKKACYRLKASSPRTHWIVKQVRGARILDIGFAGTEFPFLHYFIKDTNPGCDIIGCDLMPEKIRKIQNATGVAGDTLRLPFRADAFDCVVFAEIYEHLMEPTPALREIHRVLRPGGRLVFSTPSAMEPFRILRNWLLSPNPARRSVYRWYLGDEEHIQFPDPLSLFNILDEMGLPVVDITTKNHRIPLISRFIKKANAADLRFYPANRLGSYLCLVAEKTSSGGKSA